MQVPSFTQYSVVDESKIRAMLYYGVRHSSGLSISSLLSDASASYNRRRVGYLDLYPLGVRVKALILPNPDYQNGGKIWWVRTKGKNGRERKSGEGCTSLQRGFENLAVEGKARGTVFITQAPITVRKRRPRKFFLQYQQINTPCVCETCPLCFSYRPSLFSGS